MKKHIFIISAVTALFGITAALTSCHADVDTKENNQTAETAAPTDTSAEETDQNSLVEVEEFDSLEFEAGEYEVVSVYVNYGDESEPGMEYESNTDTLKEHLHLKA